MKKNSLKKKLMLYLSFFTIFILGGIWFLQILSLDIYYEYSKRNEIESIARRVSHIYSNDDYKDKLLELAFEKDICIEIKDKKNSIYSTSGISRECLINNTEDINNYKNDFINSDKYSIIYRITNPEFKNKTFIYGLKINDDVYAFISTSVEPVGSTVSILERQLILIIIIVLILAFLIVYSISRKVSEPIENITNTSKKISDGIYDLSFNTGTDIKEINELENVLNNVCTELSKTENLRRELLANVSHDLKTPLTLIKANAEMVRDLTYLDEAKRNKNLSTIVEEVDRLNLLVCDILDLSKMQSVNNLELQEFNINDMIKSIIKRFDIICEKEGYKIKYSGFDYIIKADKKRLEQVMYNLINNAINYTGKKKDVKVKLLEYKDYIKVEVSDSGSGINKEDLKYIWDKYYKVDKKYKRVTYGTGLGLSIVKNILILHNFKYGVDTSNSGTTFYFEINKDS